MAEGRFSKLGRFDAEFLNQLIQLLPLDEMEQTNYYLRFMKEYKNYSDKGRKKGEPENEGCVRELANHTQMDIYNPVLMARWFKEHLHTKYQKDNVRRERKAFFKRMEDAL